MFVLWDIPPHLISLGRAGQYYAARKYQSDTINNSEDTDTDDIEEDVEITFYLVCIKVWLARQVGQIHKHTLYCGFI